MLETVDARCTLRRPPRGLASWNYSRSSVGVVSYRHPEPPDGLSLISFSQTPAGDNRLRVEGNLTACRYGRSAAVASLDRDDLAPAVQSFLDLASGSITSAALPEQADWDLHRLDPSRTVVLPQHIDISEAVSAADQAWSVMANPRQVVSRHNRETVTFRYSKWRSWSVYSKTAEAASHGLTAPPRALRAEARIRPRVGSGPWKDLAPTLDLTADDLEMIVSETDELLESIASRIGATSTLAMVRALMRGGATPNVALRLASFMSISDSLGQDVLDGIGVAPSTARRWRAEVRKFYAAGGGDDQVDLDGLEMVPLLARQFVETLQENASEELPQEVAR